MSCKTHDWRAIDDCIPPRSDTESAWCRNCGALRHKSMLGLLSKVSTGTEISISHPLSDRDALTLLNIAAKAMKKKETPPQEDGDGVTLTVEEQRKLVVLLDLAGVSRRPTLVPGPEHRLLARLMVALGELHDLKNAARNDKDLQ